jgi:hypothetical protein
MSRQHPACPDPDAFDHSVADEVLHQKGRDEEEDEEEDDRKKEDDDDDGDGYSE